MGLVGDFSWVEKVDGGLDKTLEVAVAAVQDCFVLDLGTSNAASRPKVIVLFLF